MATEFLLNQNLFAECNRLAEVPARAGPTSGLLAMVSVNRKAIEFTGRCVRVSRLSGGSHPPESGADGGSTEIRARIFTEACETQRPEAAIGDNEMLRTARRRQRLLSAGNNSGCNCNVGLRHFCHRTRSTTIKGIDR